MMKGVIPAAGFGTRFLPYTKAVPKELIPVLGKPVLQYVIEEAVSAGIDRILLIISSGKEAICRHFNPDFELESRLIETKKEKLLEELRGIGRGAHIEYVYQRELDGLGGAIRYARDFVGNDPFAVLLGDNITAPCNGKNMVQELLEVFHRTESPVVAVEEVPMEIVHRYGVISGKSADQYVYELNDLVEKPPRESAPSNLAIASRYVFTPDIFDELDRTPRGKNNELQITDAMRNLLKKRPMYAVKTGSRRYDAGDKLSFLLTNLEFALKSDEYRDGVTEFLRKNGFVRR